MAFAYRIPKVLKNFNLFIADKGYAGRVDEVTLPKLALKTDEVRAGGMDSPITLDMGMEKMECSMKLLEYTPEVIKLFGLHKNNPVKVILKGAIYDESTTEKVEVELSGMWTSVEMGNFKAGDKQSMSLAMAVRYYKLSIADEELVEIDTVNLVRKIGGEDQLAEVRGIIS